MFPDIRCFTNNSFYYWCRCISCADEQGMSIEWCRTAKIDHGLRTRVLGVDGED